MTGKKYFIEHLQCDGLRCYRMYREVLYYYRLLSPECNFRGKLHILEILKRSMVQRITVHCQKRCQEKVLGLQDRLDMVL